MLNALFNIIIAPIIQILEFFFTLFFEITNNHGLAVIGLSIVVTLCTLPLYMVAEQWQEKEREIQENLKPGTKRIKKFFKGDEQYMILTTFYKQNHYHPLMALRSSFSLLIQIPFFIAAYTFLSHLEALKGVSFLFIKDFGNPDATFKIGSFYMVSPVFRRTVYHNKYWTSFDSYNDGLPRFVDNYSELDYLPQLTDATSTENSFIMIDNETVHESILLDYPDYIPTGKEATRFGPGKYAKHDHFTTMMAVFNTYEKFFDYLKSIGVYDNTRIIIVSDHGTTVQVPELKNESGSKLKKQNVVATLLVKDFYAHGPVKEDMTFMTNADTPYLATKDIVAGAKNPFTGFPFLVEDKAPFVKIQIAQAQSTRIRKQTSFPVPKDEWFTVHDNIFVKENWAPLFSDGQ